MPEKIDDLLPTLRNYQSPRVPVPATMGLEET